MAAASHVLLDDRLLIRDLLIGLDPPPEVGRSTTAAWYFRACRALVMGAGGQLSGPFLSASGAEQERAAASLLLLRDDIGLPDPRRTVPAMATLAARHRRLNLLNLEAVAAAQVLGAEVWLSAPSAAGVLPPILDAEGVPWSVVSLD